MSHIIWLINSVDAFVQRCRDLIEVCNCQIHFARWEEGNKTIVPIFAGQVRIIYTPVSFVCVKSLLKI